MMHCRKNIKLNNTIPLLPCSVQCWWSGTAIHLDRCCRRLVPDRYNQHT